MHYSNIITSESDYTKLRKAADISTDILRQLRDTVKIGITAKDIDDFALELCQKNNVKPGFKGVPGPKGPFPGNVCVSTNDEVLHAIPRKERVFQSGDIVKVDFGILHEGFFTDHCVTVGLGELSERERALIDTAKLCVDKAMLEAIAGERVGNISYVLQTIAELGNFGIVTAFCGHGIGRSLHLAPEIPSWGYQNTGELLQEGMVICVENQITLGEGEVGMAKDGWTIKSVDGSKGAMFEHMVIVRKGKPEILTLLD